MTRDSTTGSSPSGRWLPDIIDLPGGQARWAHSLTVAVGTLAAVMLLTVGRKPIRRLLLALPIGMLLHLVFDGVFSSTEVFWWPFTGSWGDVRVPSLQRGWWNIILEAIGRPRAGVDVAAVQSGRSPSAAVDWCTTVSSSSRAK